MSCRAVLVEMKVVATVLGRKDQGRERLEAGNLYRRCSGAPGLSAVAMGMETQETQMPTAFLRKMKTL